MSQIFSMLELALKRTDILSLSSKIARDALKDDVRKPAFVSTYAPSLASYVQDPWLDRPLGGPQLQEEDSPPVKSNVTGGGLGGGGLGGGGLGGGGLGGVSHVGPVQSSWHTHSQCVPLNKSSSPPGYMHFGGIKVAI